MPANRSTLSLSTATDFPEYLPETLIHRDGEFRSLEEIRAAIIKAALIHYRGNVPEVARRLGIGRSTLYRLFKSLGIDVTPTRDRSPRAYRRTHSGRWAPREAGSKSIE